MLRPYTTQYPGHGLVALAADCDPLPVLLPCRSPMRRDQLFAAFFFAAFLFLLYQFYRMFSVFVAPLTWAALLAFIFYPLYGHLLHALRGRGGLTAFVLTTLVILAVMVPMVFLI